MIIVAVYGHKNSGKTSLITSLVRKLKNLNFSVGVIKHIHHDKFEIDIEGKDTWKHRESGATFVAGVSRETFFVIDDGVKDEKLSLRLLLDFLKLRAGIDILFLEGFKEITANDPSIYKIVLLKADEKFDELIKNISNSVLGVYNFISSDEKEKIVEEITKKILKIINGN